MYMAYIYHYYKSKTSCIQQGMQPRFEKIKVHSTSIWQEETEKERERGGGGGWRGEERRREEEGKSVSSGKDDNEILFRLH